MEKAELRALFENEYPGKEKIVEQLIKPIFAKAKDKTKTDERELSEADKKQIKSFRIIAQVRGGFPITFADVEVNDSVALKRSRVSIQNCVRKVLENDSNAIIFFHFSDNAKEWRVSYCHRATSNKESTDAKRYTYLCGTEHACRTIAERFDTLKGLTTIKDEDMLNAFGVEPLSKEFFDQYREHYADLVEYISGKRFIKKGGKFVEEKTKNANGAFKNVFDGDDKLVRDYVKKTMGRLVFLHFLQKKGWLGVAKEAAWGTGDRNFIYNLFKNAGEEVKNDFLEQALEPLFFKTLNTDRGKEALAPKTVCDIYGREIRIPYLNGGLFEEDELDKKKVKFKKEHFETLLEFFNQYNFTIDETDPDDQEIGVDPEMLGKIFENLLEDNKDKGAFYTPKEIVQYMCRESLIAYLNEKTKLDARAFVINHEIAFIDAQKADLLKALLDVKVCDPAVGSGAFPMGMLNELLACTQLLTGNSKTRSELKKHIVKNNIYGVDIEKGAVDIARLRFWLAIIVDEEEPIPLPNLDYKIMQGNSLLESYEGEDLSCLTKKHEYENNQQDLFGGEDSTIKSLTKAIDGFYIPSDHIAKAKIRNQISENVIQLLKERHIPPKVINDLEKLDLHENNQFFLWHTWFNDVFNRPNKCNGFDIVIGNPPYIKEYENKSAFDGFRETSPYYIGKMDLWYGFACTALDLLAQKGHLCFIAQNNWTTSSGAKKMRNKIIADSKICQMLDFNDYMVFENASIQTMIMLFEKNTETDNYIFDYRTLLGECKKDDMLNLLEKRQSEKTSYLEPKINRKSFFGKLLTFSKNDAIFEKIAEGKVFLDEKEVAQGIVFPQDFLDKKNARRMGENFSVGDSVFGLTSKKKKDLNLSNLELSIIKPYFTSTQINRYYTNKENDFWLIYTDSSFKNSSKIEKYPNIKKHIDIFKSILTSDNKPYGLHRAREEHFFKGEKIISQRKCVGQPCFSYSDFDTYVTQTYFIIQTSRWNMKFLTGLLNSKLVAFWLKNKGKMQGANYQVDKEPLLSIPLPSPDSIPEEIQNKIITLVDKIIESKRLRQAQPPICSGSAVNSSASEADTSDFEKQIDDCVFDLYGLLPGERNFIIGKV